MPGSGSLFIHGALWHQVSSKRDNLDTSNFTQVLPDTLTFANGRTFRINYDVPQNVTDELWAKGYDDPWLKHTELSRELLQYEADETEESANAPNDEYT